MQRSKADMFIKEINKNTQFAIFKVSNNPVCFDDIVHQRHCITQSNSI